MFGLQLRQSIKSRLAGYDDTNDADRLCQDPAMRVVVEPADGVVEVLKEFKVR